MEEKKTLITGLILFVFSTYGCYTARSIEIFILMRILQAFGCTAGSVLGQVIIRDVLHGMQLAKMTSMVSIAWLGFPAIAPLFGGVFIKFFPWQNICLLLIAVGITTILLVIWRLPETRHLNINENDDGNIKIYKMSLISIACNMLKNKKTLASIFIIAACNGVVFSYYAEDSFYFTQLFTMNEIHYSLTFLIILVVNFFGGIASKKLQDFFSPNIILRYATYFSFFGIVLFLMTLCINEYIFALPNIELILFFNLFTSFFGISVVNGNAFFLGLEDYRIYAGKATSLFGFIYCIITTLYVFLMGTFHSNSPFIMPIYFATLLGLAIIISILLIEVSSKKMHNIKANEIDDLNKNPI